MAASCGALNEVGNVRRVRLPVKQGRVEAVPHRVDVASKRHAMPFCCDSGPTFEQMSLTRKETHELEQFECMSTH
jgi:hypothetical protein